MGIILVLMLMSATASAQQLGHLDTWVAVGYLSSFDGAGTALSGGVSFDLGRYVAAGFDLGYGVLGDSTDVQDRWWLMPTLALVLPLSHARLELGAGFGFGAASGYRDMGAFVQAPFDPEWAYQLVPMVRGHLGATIELSADVDGWARVEVASLTLDRTSLGSRVLNPTPRTTDTLWVHVAVGTSFHVF